MVTCLKRVDCVIIPYEAKYYVLYYWEKYTDLNECEAVNLKIAV